MGETMEVLMDDDSSGKYEDTKWQRKTPCDNCPHIIGEAFAALNVRKPLCKQMKSVEYYNGRPHACHKSGAARCAGPEIYLGRIQPDPKRPSIVKSQVNEDFMLTEMSRQGY